MWSLLGLAAAAVPDEVAQALPGTWTGSLVAGGASLRIELHVDGVGGALTATLDSPDQGVRGLAVVGLDGPADRLTFQVPAVGGAWRGALRGDALDGDWEQAGVALPLDFARGTVAPPPAARPQDPVPPLPYAVTELSVTSAPGVTLSGTLTTPAGPGPWPAVVLVSGSGPQDRDEALLGHRPFLVLADALTRAGVAVFRYDDRGVGRSSGAFATATSFDFADDAAAALAALRARPDLGPVGVLGHSEGGLVAALLAERDPQPAFVVLVAGPAVAGRRVLEGQVEALARAAGQPDPGAARAAQARLLDVVARDGTAAELEAAMAELGLPAADRRAQAAAMTSAWYRAFVKLDPAPHLAALQGPVLALFGGLDLQVPPAENLPAMRRALARNPRATVEELPGLNHLLQPARTGLPTEYAAIDTTVDPAALRRITGWVVANAR